MIDYNNKPNGYYNNARLEMLKYLPLDAKRVLDVGCGNGILAEIIKNNNKMNKEYFTFPKVVMTVAVFVGFFLFLMLFEITRPVKDFEKRVLTPELQIRGSAIKL